MVSIHGKRELRLEVEVRLLIKWTSNREIILDYPGETKVTTGSLKVERGRESGRCDYVRRSVMDGSTHGHCWLWRCWKGAMSQGMQAASRKWKMQGREYSPGTILTCTRWDPFQTSKPESFQATALVAIFSCSNRKSCSVTIALGSGSSGCGSSGWSTAFFLSLAVLLDF